MRKQETVRNSWPAYFTSVPQFVLYNSLGQYTGWFWRKGQYTGNDSIGHCQKNKLHMNTCLIPKGYWDTAVWISRPNCVTFLFVRLDEERSLQNKGGHTDELLARILYAAACIKTREDQLRRTSRDLHTRVAKCTEVDGGVLEHLLWAVTNVISVCRICHLNITLKLTYN